MTSFLLSVLLLAQAQAGGTVSGVLRDTNGKPVPNIRVALAEVPITPNETAAGSVLVSLATTSESGAYRLENIPAGRYFITAGSVDKPTYYPGTADFATARQISISAGLLLAGMDFVVRAESLPREKFVYFYWPSQRRPNQPLMFSFDSINGQILSFTAADGSPLRHDCFGSTIPNPPQDCTFLVSDPGILGGKPAPDMYGMAFRVKPGGRELEFTCQADSCTVETGATSVIRTLKPHESGVIGMSLAATFTLAP